MCICVIVSACVCVCLCVRANVRARARIYVRVLYFVSALTVLTRAYVTQLSGKEVHIAPSQMRTLLKALGLHSTSHLPVEALSDGKKRKLAILLAFVGDARVPLFTLNTLLVIVCNDKYTAFGHHPLARWFRQNH